MGKGRLQFSEGKVSDELHNAFVFNKNVCSLVILRGSISLSDVLKLIETKTLHRKRFGRIDRMSGGT